MNFTRHLVAVAVLLSGVAAAHAESGSFSCISNNSAGSCAQAEGSLSWTFDGSLFSITNAGTGYVSEVYFDVMPGVSVSFFGGAGTLFTAGANPPSLPSGNTVGFVSDFAFDSDARGAPVNGINMGETATFAITGAADGDFSAGDLFAGVHVRSLLNGNSEALVTVGDVPAVPEPSTYALMLAGLGVVGFMSRRRRSA